MRKDTNELQTITLQRATAADAQALHDIQLRAFAALLEKYRDEENPGAEGLECTLRQLSEPMTDYYFICCQGRRIGQIRVYRCAEVCVLNRIAILPQEQDKGYAQAAIKQLEALYPDAVRWELDTILQEEKLCHLYEKLGYRKNGRMEPIQPGMDLVYYTKQMR